MQIAKIQKFFELTKNIFPSTLASLFNALYINTLFRNPNNPFRIPFPFLRWPFSCRRWPSSFLLPIPPLFAHSSVNFSLFRPTCHLFPQLRTLRSNPFLLLIILARFRFLDTVNLFCSLPVSGSPFLSTFSIHCPFPVPRFRQSFPFIARFRFPVSVNHFHSLPVFRFHSLSVKHPSHPIVFSLFQLPHHPQFHCLFLLSSLAIGYFRNRFAFSCFKLLRAMFLSAVVTKNSRRAYYVLKGKRR